MSSCNKCARPVEPKVAADICRFCANSVLFCLGCSKAMEEYAITFCWNYYNEDITICPECADSVREEGGKCVLELNGRLELMCVPFEIASFLQLEFLRGRFATTG